MKFISVIKPLAAKFIRFYTYQREKKYILQIMKKNSLKNQHVEGEEVFLKKWKALGVNVSPIYYRCFANYVGKNENIISGDICSSVIGPILNPVRYRDYYEDKNIFGKLYPKEWLPKTFLRKINGIYMDEEYNIVDVNETNIYDYIGDNSRFILKPSVDSCSGRSVSLFHKEGKEMIDQNGNIFSFEFLESNYGNDFIIQACVEQSEYISQFNKTSINTIRLTAYRSVKDNKVYITNGIIRIGAENSVVDNAHSGGKFCGIDKNGHLNHYLCETYGEKSYIFNGINFKDSSFTIPNFEKIKRFAINVAEQIPHHRLIALDIAVNHENNPILIEYNIGSYGYWLFQLSSQIALEGFTDEIIDFCLKNNKYNIAAVKI